MTIYMKCTTDRLELPLAVADTAAELARQLGIKPNSVFTGLNKKSGGYHKIVIEEPKLYLTPDGGLWYKDPDTWETVFVENEYEC